MTTKPRERRFRIRRGVAPVESAAPGHEFEPVEDGFGEDPFPGSARAEEMAGETGEAIAEIRREGLTGRQLRLARRLAQKNGLSPKSDFDAVRLLRARGIDPFDRANMLEIVSAREKSQGAPEPAAPRQAASGASGQTLPQTVPDKTARVPGPPVSDAALQAHEIERIQRDIVRRRRRNLVFLAARLAAFVLLPTFAAWYYFALVATPGYATKSEFVVQHADAASVSPGLLGNTSLATSQDSIMVQDFLGSREALARLDKDHGYRDHFSDPSIDGLQRLPADASNEDVYKHYRNNVKVGYDPTEGVLRMEVYALTPEMSQAFAESLIGYAEERVDQVTERKRSDQMRGARESFDEAEGKMLDAQRRVLELQEALGVFDPTSEATSLMSQVSKFEVQLAEKRLQLQQLLDNSQPNQARVAGVEGDIGRLENLIAGLRQQLTEETSSQGSLASMTAQLRMAEVDLETRTMIMQESLQHMEAARIEAMRQVRFLSLGVAPIPPDDPTYPRVFENTLIALIVFAALYLVVSLTVAVLREQVSS